MEEKLIKCSKISVDFTENDPVDVKCGGPKYLGFDFFVKNEEDENMIKFIDGTLTELKVPCYRIYVNGIFDLNPNKVWSKEKIITTIKNDADELIQESHRSYSKRR